MDASMKFLFLLLFLNIHAWAEWSVSTYNIRNFDNDPSAGGTNIEALGKIIKEIKSDVMAFEEVVNKVAFTSLIKNNLPGYEYKISTCGGFGKQYLAVVYNPKIFKFVKKKEDLSLSGQRDQCGSLRPIFLVTLKKINADDHYTFGALHLKAGGSSEAMMIRWNQYEKLQNFALKSNDENLIFLGDFNTTGFNIRNQDFEKFNKFLSESRMKSLSETIGCTSYWKGLGQEAEFQSSILDHVVIPQNLLSSVDTVRAGAHCAAFDCHPATPDALGMSFQSVSDHCPVKVTFN
jgi:endonuclease/exonuclease/phosphatase family metal-dependent hydrolase